MNQFAINNSPVMMIILLAFIIWSLIWKGIALWKAARNNQQAWYVVMLIVNTLGILEILYIYVFSKMNLKGKKEEHRKKR